MALKQDITIVSCIECGRLEEQTVLMIRSLRMFGGRLANAPVITVIGRAGPSLRPTTISELDILGVRIVKSASSDNPASWFNYGNKAAAVLVAERLAVTPQITWVDSDVLFMREPLTIRLEDQEELAVAPIATPPLVTPGNATHRPYWLSVCRLFDVNFDSLPLINFQGRSQKPNFNSGVFTWKRGSSFAKDYHTAFIRLLKSRIAQHNGEFFTVDQVILTPLSATRRWKAISESDHVFSPADLIAAGGAPSLEGVGILHYSTSLSSSYRSEMERSICNSSAFFYDWFRDQKIYLGKLGVRRRTGMTILRLWRGMHWRLYQHRIRRVRAGSD